MADVAMDEVGERPRMGRSALADYGTTSPQAARDTKIRHRERKQVHLVLRSLLMSLQFHFDNYMQRASLLGITKRKLKDSLDGGLEDHQVQGH